MQKGKMVVSEDLQIAEKRREPKGKGGKERYTHQDAEFQKLTRRERENKMVEE